MNKWDEKRDCKCVRVDSSSSYCEGMFIILVIYRGWVPHVNMSRPSVAFGYDVLNER